jgi:hypothetical protein
VSKRRRPTSEGRDDNALLPHPALLGFAALLLEIAARQGASTAVSGATKSTESSAPAHDELEDQSPVAAEKKEDGQ